MENIRNYFNAEKQESVLFVLAGAIAIAFAVYFLFFQKEPFYKGLAYPLITVALLQIGVGGSVLMRSTKDIQRVEHYIQWLPEQVKKVELPRMKTVMKNFIVYRYVEIALLIFGLLSMFYLGTNAFIKGIGTGLFIQSALMLIFDFFAEKRGWKYFNYLKTVSDF